MLFFISFFFIPLHFFDFFLDFFSLFAARSARILRRWREVSSTLNHISTIWEYRNFLTIHKSHLDVSQLKLLKSKYRPALSKLRKLDISLASDILFPLYSHTGRPTIDPAVLVRSFVLMNNLKPFILCCKWAAYFQAFICRTIVNENYFKIWVFLL